MSAVTESILLSVKKLCGVAPEYKAFDDDFILWINAALSDVNQLGVGPAEGFEIEDEFSEWIEFLGDSPIYNRVKTYVAKHVRLSFDPPNTSFGIQMIKEQLEEQAWRIVAAQEDIEAAEEAG